jgi:Hemerythrin HHE cation binding domain
VTLEPHIAWEDGWLYPEIEAWLGTPWATRAARFDHQQIRQMAEYLSQDQARLTAHAPGDQQAETRCHLFSLEALVRAHLEREERFLIPLLIDDAPGDGVASPS